MKKQFKVFSMLLIIVMCLNCSAVSFASNSSENLIIEEKHKKAISVLTNAGWEENDIYDMLSEEEILTYADVESVVTSEKKYYKVSDTQTTEISENQCHYEINKIKKDFIANLTPQNSGISVCSMVIGDTVKDETKTTDGYFTYYVQAYRKGSVTFILSARYEWLISPKNRKIDVFGLGHDTNLTKNISSSDVHYVYKADITNLADGTTYTYQTTNADEMKVGIGGVVVKQKLNSDPTAVNHRGYLRYDAVKNNSTATAFEIFAEYYHQQTTIQVSPVISFPSGGSISVSPSESFKFMSPNPHVGGTF